MMLPLQGNRRKQNPPTLITEERPACECSRLVTPTDVNDGGDNRH